MAIIQADIVVIGGGMAGASAAHHLAARAKVVLLEAEREAGYHSTGRSAALFSSTYGHPAIRLLSRASRPLFDALAGSLTQAPVLKPQGMLCVAGEGQIDDLDALEAETLGAMRRLDTAEALVRAPILRPEAAQAALEEPEAARIDVSALHQGYLAALRRREGEVICGARVASLERDAGGWLVLTDSGVSVRAARVVNAAGAWAGAVGELAGLGGLGLQPKRRSAALVSAPDGVDPASWSFTTDVAETFYFGPDAGRLLISAAEEADSPPCDARPEEIETATAVDRVERATTLEVRRVLHRWAGLRTFAPDRLPVVGYDPRASGFFWLAGQGGYGIQTAPALSLLAAALVLQDPVPPALQDAGVPFEALAPERLLEPEPGATGDAA